MSSVKKDVAIDLFVYGLVLVGFSLVGYWRAALVPPALLAAGVVVGVFIATLAVLAARGYGVRQMCVATLVVVLLTLLAQAALSWYRLSRDSPAKGTPMILTMLSIFALGQLAALRRQ